MKSDREEIRLFKDTMEHVQLSADNMDEMKKHVLNSQREHKYYRMKKFAVAAAAVMSRR